MVAKIFIYFILSVCFCAVVAAAYNLVTQTKQKLATLPKSYACCAGTVCMLFVVIALVLLGAGHIAGAAILSSLAFLAAAAIYIFLFYRVYFNEDEMCVFYFIKKYLHPIAAVKKVHLSGKNTVITTDKTEYVLFFMLENISELREYCKKNISEHEENSFESAFDESSIEGKVEADSEQSADDKTSEIESAVLPNHAIKSGLMVDFNLIIAVTAFIIAACFSLYSLFLPIYAQSDLSQAVITIAQTKIIGSNIDITAEQTSRRIIIKNYSDAMADSNGFLALEPGETITISLTKDKMPLDMRTERIEVFSVARIDGRTYMTPEKALENAAASVKNLRVTAVIFTILIAAAFIYLFIFQRDHETKDRSTLTTM